MNPVLNYISSICLVCLILTSCTKPINNFFKEKSPYEKYKDKLTQSGIDKTILGSEWISEGEKALKDSIIIKVPFREIGFFSEKQVRAASFNFLARRGEIISIKLTWQPIVKADIFLELFKSGDHDFKLIHVSDSALSISLEITETSKYLIRMQPEILGGGKYIIEISSKPSLPFPIPGKNSSSVGSFFNDLRENGTRRHEGIDIFAPKRTPVIAIVNGKVTGYKENKLGGKVVFINDKTRSQTLYYAHLDSQYVSVGQDVKAGDTIGLVGNTGNAKLTLPHLHFTIYKWSGGAIDPFPFVEAVKDKFEPIIGQEKMIGMEKIIKIKNSLLFKDLSSNIKPKITLPMNTIVTITGAYSKYYKVELPGRTKGYINVQSFPAQGK